MNIIIFGASGASGIELVKQALDAGHHVTAFVRNPQKLKVNHINLKFIKGDVKDYHDVEQAIKQHDAVISALGVSKPLKKDPVVIKGIMNITKAMRQGNINRIIYLSFIGVGESQKDAGFMIDKILSKVLKNEIEDHEEKENLVKNSGLEWTIVRPPKLTNGRLKGQIRSGDSIKSNSFFPMFSRADLANFMLCELADNKYLYKSVRVLY